MKLNLGSGKDYRKDWINVDLGNKNDLGEEIKVDCSWDLNNFHYPFADNTFDEIWCNQILEHLDNPPKVIKELLRIARKDCVITIRVPHFSDVGAYENPTHKHYFSLNSIDFMSYGCKVGKEFEYSHNKILKVIQKIFTIYPFFYEKFLRGFVPISGIKWRLTK